MSKSIYIDVTELCSSGINTGIQRVERNIVNSVSVIENEYDVLTSPVVYLGKILGLRLLQKDSVNKAFKYRLGYFENICLCLLSINRLKKITKAIFPFINNLIDKNWDKYRYLLLPFLILIIPIISGLSLLFVLTKKRVLFEKEDIYFIPGSSWVAYDLEDSVHKAKMGGAKIVLLLHDLIVFGYPEFFEQKEVININSKIRSIITDTDLIVCVSDYTKKMLCFYLKQSGYNNIPKIDINYSGFKLDLIEWNSLIRDNLIRDIADDSYIVIGTIEPRKNYGYLINAFELVWDSGIDTKLLIIGKYGWKSKDMVRRITQHHLYKKKLFWFDDLNDNELLYAYQHAKACVYPSVVEGFGLPLIEALSLRCPVLASDIPVFNEIGGKYCYYFSLESPMYLAELIEKVEKDGLLDDLSYLDSFSWPDWIQSTSNLLKKILQN